MHKDTKESMSKYCYMDLNDQKQTRNTNVITFYIISHYTLQYFLAQSIYSTFVFANEHSIMWVHVIQYVHWPILCALCCLSEPCIDVLQYENEHFK